MCIACAGRPECVISSMLIKHNVNFSDGVKMSDHRDQIKLNNPPTRII